MNRRTNRAGFSLIEMLVVITIIGIVAAVMLGAGLGVGGAAARKAATKTTLEKVDSILQAKLNALRRDFDDQERKKARVDVFSPGPPPAAKVNWFNVISHAEAIPLKYPTLLGVPTNPASTTPWQLAARIAVVKMDRYRGLFPQRVRDCYGLNNADDGAVYFDDSPLLDYWKSSTPIWNNTPRNLSAHKPETESSELLYLCLSFGKATGASVSVLDDINPRHLKDTDGDGVPEIYDDWGNMLRFYNAPTRLARPSGTVNTAPTVPTAEQYSVAEKLIAGFPARPTNPAQAADFSNSFNQNWMDTKNGIHLVLRDSNATAPALQSRIDQFEALFLTPDTYWRPMIVSAGEDGDYGLGDPVGVGPERLAGPSMSDLTTAADNLTNLQRLGGN